MARMLNFRNLIGNMFPNMMDNTSSVTLNLSLINAYKNQISNYEHNRGVLYDAIGMIDQTVSQLTSVNELIDNVIINGEKYDKDKLEDMISRLGTLRSNFESFVTNCNTEIERLENLLVSVKDSVED